MLSTYVKIIPAIYDYLERNSGLHKKLSSVLREDVLATYGASTACVCTFDEIGCVEFPFTEIGNVASTEMFGLDEIAVFSYYIKNKSKYKRVLDIGANLGIHSIILGKLGCEVTAFEPDPDTAILLERNIRLNALDNVSIEVAAVSNMSGTASFCRVIDNKAGSHLAGMKADPYGPLDYFDVCVKSIEEYFDQADYMKIDAEGSEAKIITAIEPNRWSTCDAFVEIGSAKNAQDIYRHFMGSNINLFSQKNNWRTVQHLSHLPTHHSEGLAFISASNSMNW